MSILHLAILKQKFTSSIFISGSMFTSSLNHTDLNVDVLEGTDPLHDKDTLSPGILNSFSG